MNITDHYLQQRHWRHWSPVFESLPVQRGAIWNVCLVMDRDGNKVELWQPPHGQLAAEFAGCVPRPDRALQIASRSSICALGGSCKGVEMQSPIGHPREAATSHGRTGDE